MIKCVSCVFAAYIIFAVRRSEASKNGIVIVHGTGGWAGGRAGGRKQKWATGPRVTKVGTEVHPNTLLNFTGNGVSSYFRSAAIRHFVNFDILNFCPFLPNGLIKIHKIWCEGHTRSPTHNNRKWRHWLLPVGRTAAILIFTLRRRSPKRFCRISPNLIGLTYIPSDIFQQNMTSSATSFRQQTPFWKKIFLAKNELLVLGSPNLIQRFTTTLSQNLPEVVPPATSGR